MIKPYAEACDKNRAPILSIIQILFVDRKAVLEIGSGTGQHAIFFAERMPHLVWHTSDLKECHAGIKEWIRDAEVKNVRAPLELDVMQSPWPVIEIDAVFSANSLHIMHWPAVEKFFDGAGNCLPPDGKLVVYGPFNYHNQYTSESNERFDGWLKARDPQSGIRNFEDLCELAVSAGMGFIEDYEMPANNRILYWQKIK